jgi:transcriptional regulator with XRE-family HTH domain
MAEHLSRLAFNLREVAALRGLTLKKLADEAGVSEKGLHDILHERSIPSLATVLILARHLRVKPSDLLLPNRELMRKLAKRRRSRR